MLKKTSDEANTIVFARGEGVTGRFVLFCFDCDIM